MTETSASVEPYRAEFELELEYMRAPGESVATCLEFLQQGELWGRKCSACGRVAVPATDYCEWCGAPTGSWEKLEGCGTVVGVTEAPSDGGGYVLVRLDGAGGTSLLHKLIGSDVEAGDRVRLEWSEERTGSILDIAGFAPEQADLDRSENT